MRFGRKVGRDTAMNRDLDAAAWEVVLFNALIVMFGSFMVSAGMLINEAAALVLSPYTLVKAGYVLLIVAGAFALFHRNVARDSERVKWYAAIVCEWAGSLCVASAAISMPQKMSTVLYVLMGIVLLVGATCLRASRPRDMMWQAIIRTRTFGEMANRTETQLKLPL
ncbi:hypothetical protein A3C20_03080 [Candidatus Kaiserbacteria bacterium RIFCSPHIGHO2_02_FULL_55_25]|uniref:Uncharacterized protein n=1 Tax=Candidatus Kaiserbacteria bacterium RIFCSPHIGHO2_02_FULL_55_25 TaxID=1798498 RepID=A0A1F6E6E5_9BACT|nr:MAG: hypothetical protein A3C20_03080 [Candidatus Kaiserbacteria bacterium RIFCSPHIGHO2_02_FULL_55_25]OGG77663.1 MAG: hypothetical protein A3F56_01635 [Candidatus Kaiserbacteria bacterium RIFCSPHIGHO2_12_FULL_55_13]OGG83882.1 MAG: hypothetical protein A3A42_00085 [Candidatus Kaiserbacteria bacterium RIFCSPLOWO2_01_FULL_55_25]